MKKLIVVLSVFFAVPLFSQIYPTEFPKIGYEDMWFLSLHPTFYNLEPNRFSYASSSWFYPQLVDLGLTHVMTNADFAVSLNPTYNNSLKILDANFANFTISNMPPTGQVLHLDLGNNYNFAVWVEKVYL